MRPVLIVEDDDDIREVLQAVLEQEGYEVETAHNGREALAALARGLLPAVILLDLMMPVMNGWELLRQLRADAALAPIPVVVTTASGSAPTDGAQAVVRKPYELDDLTRLVHGLSEPQQAI